MLEFLYGERYVNKIQKDKCVKEASLCLMQRLAQTIYQLDIVVRLIISFDIVAIYCSPERKVLIPPLKCEQIGIIQCR